MAHTYRRRSSKAPSELDWITLDTSKDVDSEASVSASDNDEVESAPVSRRTRRSLAERSVQKKRRRASDPSQDCFNLKVKNSKSFRTPSRAKRAQRRGSEGCVPDQPQGESFVENRPEWMQSPVEFVMEKRAMFAAIDAFQLESEEESADEKPGVFVSPTETVENREPTREDPGGKFMPGAMDEELPENSRMHAEEWSLSDGNEGEEPVSAQRAYEGASISTEKQGGKPAFSDTHSVEDPMWIDKEMERMEPSSERDKGRSATVATDEAPPPAKDRDKGKAIAPDSEEEDIPECSKSRSEWYSQWPQGEGSYSRYY